RWIRSIPVDIDVGRLEGSILLRPLALTAGAVRRNDLIESDSDRVEDAALAGPIRSHDDIDVRLQSDRQRLEATEVRDFDS
ncbi:MAG: hypothetical protein E6501_13750, partial [Bradyrhizobium sp.]|nr:hypothetical protein [Bradyrhizobium sp.]